MTTKKRKVKPAPKAKKAAKKAAKKTLPASPRKIISAGEAPPVRVVNPSGSGLGVIVVDHASNRVPKALKDMGLKKNTLKQHIAWDIGAEDASLYLSRALDMPAVVAEYSRLVIDLNRAPAHIECIPEVSDHITIPANKSLSKKQRDQRLKEVYWPYQKTIGTVVDRFVKKKKVPFILSVHSYTPEMDGKKRPWHIALLWNKEREIARKVVQNIRRAHPDILVGENEPYTLKGDRFQGSTVWRHAEERGLPYIFVEFRQDLVDTRKKAQDWAALLLEAIRPVLDDPESYRNRPVKPSKK